MDHDADPNVSHKNSGKPLDTFFREVLVCKATLTEDTIVATTSTLKLIKEKGGSECPLDERADACELVEKSKTETAAWPIRVHCIGVQTAMQA